METIFTLHQGSFGAVWDVSDPTAITSYSGVASFDESVFAMDIAVTDNYTFAVSTTNANGDSFVGVADSSNPSGTQSLVAELAIGNSDLKAVELFGDHLVAFGKDAIHVVDVSNPEYPVKVSENLRKNINAVHSHTRGDLTFIAGEGPHNGYSIVI